MLIFVIGFYLGLIAALLCAPVLIIAGQLFYWLSAGAWIPLSLFGLPASLLLFISGVLLLIIVPLVLKAVIVIGGDVIQERLERRGRG